MFFHSLHECPLQPTWNLYVSWPSSMIYLNIIRELIQLLSDKIFFDNYDINTNSEHWSLNSDQWTVNRDQWTVNSDQWTVNSERWTANSEQRSVNSGQWPVDSEQWTGNSGQWTVNSEQWSANSGQWTVISEQWTVNNEQWTVNTIHDFYTICKYIGFTYHMIFENVTNEITWTPISKNAIRQYCQDIELWIKRHKGRGQAGAHSLKATKCL